MLNFDGVVVLSVGELVSVNGISPCPCACVKEIEDLGCRGQASCYLCCGYVILEALKQRHISRSLLPRSPHHAASFQTHRHT